MYNFITRLIDSPADLFSETSWTQKNKTKPRLAGCLIGSTIILSMGHATAQNYTLETIAEGLDTPWSIAELPNGGFLITERTGGLKFVDANGLVNDIAGVPPVFAQRQGGLFDVILHPNYADNSMIYLAYAAGDEDSNRTTIARARLGDNALENLEVIYGVTPTKRGGGHFGGRMAFLSDGTLLLSSGEGYAYREEAQSIENELGKLLRMTESGAAPTDNPYPKESPYVYSYGHRNPQGLVVDPETQAIWLTEHGPKGGDELNFVEKGKNYGWPAITYGVDYSGAIISPYTELPGMEQPVNYWVPSIATSGLALYQSDAIPGLKGRFLVGGLKAKKIVAVDVSGATPIETEPFPDVSGRVRDVRALSDGSIAVLFEAEGRAIRIIPNI